MTEPVPVTGERAPAAEPQELVPQAARRAPVAVTKTAPSRRLQPGDLICGACGEGNLPIRKFCSRCGQSLVAAEIVKTPWWHRFIPRRGPKVVELTPTKGRRGKPGMQRAGSVAHQLPRFDIRHLPRQIYRWGRLVVAAAIVVVGALYASYPPFHLYVNRQFSSAKSSVAGTVHHSLVPVNPVKYSANVTVPGHPASFALDQFTNTYWLAPYQTSDPPTLTLTFAHPVTLEQMLLRSGASTDYIGHGRPDVLVLTFSNHETDTITAVDTSAPQTFSLSHAVLVKSVQIRIGGVYQGLRHADVAIAAIDFFALP